MEQECNVKREEVDDPATCIPAESEVKIQLDTFSQTGCSMVGPHRIKKEETFVISSYHSLANDQTRENNLSDNEDCKEGNYSKFPDTKSDMTTWDRNSAASFTDHKESIDDTDKCIIVKAETGEICEVIYMSKENTSQSELINMGETQDRKVSLRQLSRSRDKPFRCYGCNFSCAVKSNLMRHKRTHTGEKPFKCDECDYASSKKNNLQTHKRTHTGEKPFKCDECDYACSNKGSLKIHKRIHTGEKPFKCDECKYSSTHKGTLIRHKRRHTGKKPFKCDKCDYSCSQKVNLIRHKRKHSGDKPFRCDG